jgi:Protein kinase domain
LRFHSAQDLFFLLAIFGLRVYDMRRLRQFLLPRPVGPGEDPAGSHSESNSNSSESDSDDDQPRGETDPDENGALYVRVRGMGALEREFARNFAQFSPTSASQDGARKGVFNGILLSGNAGAFGHEDSSLESPMREWKLCVARAGGDTNPPFHAENRSLIRCSDSGCEFQETGDPSGASGSAAGDGKSGLLCLFRKFAVPKEDLRRDVALWHAAAAECSTPDVMVRLKRVFFREAKRRFAVIVVTEPVARLCPHLWTRGDKGSAFGVSLGDYLLSIGADPRLQSQSMEDELRPVSEEAAARRGVVAPALRVQIALEFLDALDGLHLRGRALLVPDPFSTLFIGANATGEGDGSGPIVRLIWPGPPVDDLPNRHGLPGFVAPEIMRDEPLGVPADMWAFGELLFLMGCGTTPFSRVAAGSTIMQIFDNILRGEFDYAADEANASAVDDADRLSAAEKAAIEKLLEVDVSQRGSAKDVRELLGGSLVKAARKRE